MTGQPEHVLVVGAGLGGLRTAEHLRVAGYQGRISLVGAEPYPPYDRPPLSKQVLTVGWGPERVELRGADALDELGIRTHLHLEAVALRHHGGARGQVEVELGDGATLYGDAVVIATGLVARRLPGQPDNVHTLRTLDDAIALRATLDRVGSLLVVGGGFIGAEVASAARGRGIEVTVLEALAVPAERALGAELGALAGRLMTEAGVDLRVGARIVGFPDAGERVAVELADGTVLDADAGIVGVGGSPRLGWLPAEGPDGDRLDVSDGLACSSTGRVHGLPGVWAVGDVASWEDRRHGDRHRSEHWTSAGDQAIAVAHDILGMAPPAAPVPYFWSDQCGLKIQLIGRPELAESVLALHGDGLGGGPVRGTVVAYLTGERLVAVAGFGAARMLARYRALVAAGASRTAAVETAASLSPAPSS